MAKLKVPYYSKAGEELEPLEIEESIFGEKVLYKTLHQIVVGYGCAKRAGTHSAKSKDEVAGSGKKPWRQKGTGRARVGCKRAPHWRGGGVAFATKPRDYRKTMSKKMKKAALNSAFLGKFIDSEVKIIEGFEFENDAPKTRVVAELLAKVLGDQSCKSILIGNADYNKQLYLSTKNISKTKINQVANFNAYDVVRNKYIVLTKEAFDSIIEARLTEPDSKV